MKKIAVVCAKWHDSIVKSAKISFNDSLVEKGLPQNKIDYFEVPGSLEIPLAAKLLAESGQYSAIAAIGFVVNGGIYRHEFVAAAVLNGIVSVSIATSVPVISMVLTPIDYDENDDQRTKYFVRHMRKKGREGADAVWDSVKLADSLKAIPLERNVQKSAIRPSQRK